MLKSGNMCGNLRYSWGLLSALLLVAQNVCIKPKKWRLNPFVKIPVAPYGSALGTTLFFHTCRVRVLQNSLRQRKDGFLRYSNLQAFLSISVMTSDLAQGKKAQLEAPSQLARPHNERRHIQTKKEPFWPLPTRTFPTGMRQCNLESVHLVFGLQMSLSQGNGKK